jgi:tetratricopeptide (TPR) repeat protein
MESMGNYDEAVAVYQDGLQHHPGHAGLHFGLGQAFLAKGNVGGAVDAFREEPGRRLISIQATIHVEKESQKAILIGRKGAMLKEIGTRARQEMERFFDSRIFLELFVRVQKDWTRDPRALREFGYADEEGP